RSRFFSAARFRASRADMMPSCAPSGPITRSSLSRISPFICSSCLLMVKHLHHTCDNFVLRAVQQNKRTEPLCPQINSAETPFGTCCDIDLCQTVLHGCERMAPLCFLNDYTTCIPLCQRENQLFSKRCT